MKKQILVLALGMSLTAPMYSMDFDVADFKSKAMELRREAEKHFPIIQNVVQFIKSGDLDGLQSYLQEKAGDINVGPAFKFAQSNFGKFKDVMREALDRFPLEQIPAGTWRDRVQVAMNTIKSNWNQWDMVESRMNQVIPLIDLRNNIAYIANGLKKIAATPQFKALQPDLEQYFNTQIKPAYNAVRTADFDAIARAMEEVAKKLQEKPFDLSTVLIGLGEARRLAPHVAGLIEGSAGLVVKINNALVSAGAVEKMPSDLRTGFEFLQDNSGKIRAMLDELNAEINSALGR